MAALRSFIFPRRPVDEEDSARDTRAITADLAHHSEEGRLDDVQRLLSEGARPNSCKDWVGVCFTNPMPPFSMACTG